MTSCVGNKLLNGVRILKVVKIGLRMLNIKVSHRQVELIKYGKSTSSHPWIKQHTSNHVRNLLGLLCGMVRVIPQSPVSGIATVSKSRLVSEAGRVRVAHCFCNRSSGGASILADPVVLDDSQNTSSMPLGHSRDTRWSVWQVDGGHLAFDTWWLLSRD